MLSASINTGYQNLSVLSNSTGDLSKSESVDAVRFYRNYKTSNKVSERRFFEVEYLWQKTRYEKLNLDKFYYNRFFSTRRLPEREKGFEENPFYFHDHSFGLGDSGKGDYYLYGLYAGWPHILMVDKKGYFSNENEFLKLTLERFLSHKNSLLSSASTTQIVGRINKNMTVPSVLNELRPKDPMIRSRMLERHAIGTTVRKDHNKEALEPYAASVNFPPQYPINFDESRPFPKSLKELALKQQRKRMMIAPDHKEPPLIGKPSPIAESENIFPISQKNKTESLLVDAETQTTGDFLFPDIKQKFNASDRLAMNELKDWYHNFYDRKKIPLRNYQYSVFYLSQRLKGKPRGFYDIQPKVESPWLSRMIKERKFTRKYYLENFPRVPHVIQQLATPTTSKIIKSKPGKTK